MSDWLNPETFEVPTRGGKLNVARWGEQGPVVLALHGITASQREWPYLGRALAPDAQLVAPDLRGRGDSRELPGPFGMNQHADDCVAVLDHLGVESATVVGHSMGGFVATVMATHHPDRVSSLVLLDGGVPLFEPSPDVDIEQLLIAMLGPSLQRLEMTFESVDACLEFWKVHPAMQDEGAWNEMFRAFVTYDLMGEPPNLRSKVNRDAVLGDGRDLITNPDVYVALEKISCPITFVRAPRGILNEPTGLYSDEVAADLQSRIAGLRDVLVEDVNHWTLMTLERGAEAVAGEIRSSMDA